MTRYLTVDEVCRINEAEVGSDMLADFGLVESAVLRPQQSVGGQNAYPGLHSKAAALFHWVIGLGVSPGHWAHREPAPLGEPLV